MPVVTADQLAPSVEPVELAAAGFVDDAVPELVQGAPGWPYR